MSLSNRIAVYTGSFDPLHLGHENIIRRAAALYEKVVVGIGVNPEKSSYFDSDARAALIRAVLADVPNVVVEPYHGLTVQFVRDQGARVLLRGIRALSDIEYEFSMSLTNSSLAPEIESVFLMAQKEYTHLSSSLIRQIAALGGDLRGFVPEAVGAELRAKHGR
ncbi:MAG: pantetheine-phosphate adenylyltransferase [Planctomycetia bacterium]